MIGISSRAVHTSTSAEAPIRAEASGAKPIMRMTLRRRIEINMTPALRGPAHPVRTQ
jgi:hypothetical protein